ncbi:OmpA family protein [Hymenobacter terricola]|uniref:OmpA family protein n=1 Tax=Hymenobacter terricola TaxID=2819236 RepID=UPI001B30AB85|nr:OmpA family protein [Hymenobacter terricola]
MYLTPRGLFPLLLLALSGTLRAQPAPPLATYTDAQARYQVAYPGTWQLRKDVAGAEAAFYAPATGRPVPAVATLTVRELPDAEKELKLTAAGGQDSTWRRVLRLPQAQVLRIEQRDNGPYDEVRYDYTYAATALTRTHVVGRQVWRGGYELRTEYRAETSQDGRYLAQGQQLVESFAFTAKGLPSRRYADQQCDNKMYGIAASHRVDGQLLDDCRTIHEFATEDLTNQPIIHRQALPFQSYALAKGFDNCLYSVTKAPTDAPELVYRYDPAARQGRYTTWRLPAQGPDVSWISAATDDKGDLYFLTSDANQLVKVDPTAGAVTVVWKTDPLQKAPFYRAIGFPGAGTHGNFCLDDAHTMYLVYSTDGSLLKVDLNTLKPFPDLMPLEGLPERGGYSDLLMQNDEAGRRRLYLAGPRALYKVDLARQKATRVRQGTYTDLAGCNVFRIVPRTAPAAPLPTVVLWRGRVLNAITSQPLPEAQLRFGPEGDEMSVPITAQGNFAYAAVPGQPYAAHAQLAGYLAIDTLWTAGPGTVRRDILLRPFAVGTTLPLDNVQFEQGQAVLLPTSAPALDQLVRLMTDNPRLTIELRGHTDNVGPPEKNVVLSEQRVAAVKAYLVGHGVAEGRISGIGYGGAQPVASNAQEITRRLNRRVEFRVTGLQ